MLEPRLPRRAAAAAGDNEDIPEPRQHPEDLLVGAGALEGSPPWQHLPLARVLSHLPAERRLGKRQLGRRGGPPAGASSCGEPCSVSPEWPAMSLLVHVGACHIRPPAASA